MRSVIGIAAALGLSLAGLAQAQTAIVIPPPIAVPDPPAGGNVRPFAFTHLVAKLAPGKEWSSPHGGWFCRAYPRISWKGGQQDVKGADYLEAFRSEMKTAGFKIDGDSDNIFEKSTATSDMQVGAIINDIDLSYCLPGILVTAHPLVRRVWARGWGGSRPGWPGGLICLAAVRWR
jgi:hypothetical protein